MSVDEIAETACAGVGPYDQDVADAVYAVLLRHGDSGAALDSDVHKCIARALASTPLTRVAVVGVLRKLASEAYELPFETGVSRFIDRRANDIESGEDL